MAVLVTGIGYIGAKLVSDLVAAGEEVVAIENFFATDPAAVRVITDHPNCHLFEGSFGDRRVLAAVFSRHRIETIYALAAQSSPYSGAAPARYTEMTNLLAPRQLLDAAVRYGVRSIVFASSLKVYGETSQVPDENTAYGKMLDLSHLSKCYVEKLLEMYASLHGLRCVPARLGIVYGLSPVMKTDYRFMTAPNKFCRQLAMGEAIEIYPGSARLAGLVHVADACDALRCMAAAETLDGYVPVTVATEWASIATVAAIVQGLVVPGQPASFPSNPIIAHLGGTLTSIGFQPRRTLANGLPEVFRHFAERTQDELVETGSGTL